MPHDPLAWIEDQLAAWTARGLRRTLKRRDTRQSAAVEIDGRRLVNFSSNDYLGLAAEPALAQAATKAAKEHGWGSGASPLVTGRSNLHAELEQRLAEFEGTEAALLFPTGFAANVGTVSTLACQGDVIFSDAKNHASLIDGTRLSAAEVVVYPHRDVDRLARLLRESSSTGRRLIVTDSLFSMDGDLAPLAKLAELAEEHEAMLLVDEAHATGVFGPHGHGLCEHFGVEDGVHIRIGTLSKALGSLGGFVVGRQSLIDWLANRARTYVFSTAAPAAVCAAGLAALDLVKQQPQRREELLARAARFRQQLQAAGFETGDSESQIVPVILGTPERTMHYAESLASAGYLVPGIRPPSVPEGESLLRISLSWLHNEAMLGGLLKAICAVE